MNRKQAKLSLSIRDFSVNAEAGILTDVALMTANREAEGHGFWLDSKTIETVKEAIEKRGGRLRGAITHGSWGEYMETGGDRILSMPGWFDDIGISSDKLTAKFEFYEAWRAANTDAFAILIEMAEKTPDLFGISLELSGYLVYVGADGTEYNAEPEDVELKYDGLPVFRVVEAYFGSFVDIPAANAGLFASLSAKLGKDSATRAQTAIQSLAADNKKTARHSVPSNETGAQAALDSNRTNTKTENLMDIIDQLNQKYGSDEARLQRALLAFSKAPNKDKITVEDIDATLKREDAAKEKAETAARLKALEDENEKLKADKTAAETDRDDFKKKFQQIKKSGTTDADDIDLSPGGAESVNGKTGLTAKVLSMLPPERQNLAVTSIDDLFIPDVWVRGMSERKPIFPGAFLTSGVIVESPELTARASAGGDKINLPFFHDIDFEDEPQQEGTGPTIHGLDDGKMIAPRISRVGAIGASALSAGLSGADPVNEALNAFARLRDRNALRRIIYILRGAFGNTAATGAFNALRTDAFTENYTGTGDYLIDSDVIDDAAAGLGELVGVLSEGVILMHPIIRNALKKQDKIETIRASEGNFILQQFEGIPIIPSSLLFRPGTTAGNVFETYILAPRTIAVGSKPQSNTTGDISSFLRKEDENLNEVTFYDRLSGFLHPNGLRWAGTPANPKGGPSNIELADEDNWELAFEHVENVGIVQVRTNG